MSEEASVLAKWFGGIRVESLNEERFGERHAHALRAERLAQVFSLTPLLMVTNIVISSLCALVFVGQGMNTLLLMWLAFIGTIAGYGLYSSLTRGKHRRPSGSVRAKRLVVRHAAILSIAWVFPPLILFPVAEGYQGYILTGVMAGMMAGGAFALAPVPRAAFTWLGVCTVANVAAFVGIGDPMMFGLAIATLVWAVLIANNVLRLAVAETERFAQAAASVEHGVALEQQRDELAEQRDVIDLLLREYETDGGDWRWRTDPNGVLLRAPDELLRILALTSDDIATIDCFKHVTAKGLPESADNVTTLRARVAARERFTDLTIAVRDERPGEDGMRWISLSGKPQWTQTGMFDGYRGIAADVTAHHEAERRVRHLATRDALTGLWNRTSLSETLDALILSRQPFAYAQIDLDKFKACNDRLGHQAGDELLCVVAGMLREAALAHTGPDAMVARIGGDEFALVVPGNDVASCVRGAEAFAARAVGEIGKAHHLQAGTATIGTSVGIATHAGARTTASEVVRAADIALYRAKAEGRGCFRVYTVEMDREHQLRLALETDLRTALERGEMSLAYQPIVSLASARTKAMEALLRWRHPVHGEVSPTTFIPIAEEGGFIDELGEWVLRNACREAAHWPDEQIVTVNVSAIQLRSLGFAQTVMSALAAAQLCPTRLEIEVTESALLDDFDTALRTLRALREIGVSIALDDFGTGYAGLSYLSEFKFDRIKIDRSFVSTLLSNDSGAGSIVRAIIDMAQTLGVSTTAEGVEKGEQIEILRNFGCEEIQGFLLGRPDAPDLSVRRTDEPAHPPKARHIRVSGRPERRVA